MSDQKVKKPVHCIHYIPRVCLENGGVVRFVLDICQVLSDQGIKVTLLTQNAVDVPEHWFSDAHQPDVVEIKPSGIPGGFFSPSGLEEVAKLFDSNTVINFHIPWILSNFQLARLANKHQVPYIVTPHGSLDVSSMEQKALKKNIFWFLYGKKHYQDAVCIHYTAASERDQAEKYVVNKRAKIIPCLFDTNEFKELPPEQLAREKFPVISDDKPNILFLSRVHPKKGTDILVEATKLLADKGIEVNVLLAGPDDTKAKGYRDKLKQLISKYNLVDSVHLLGMVKGQEKLSLYKSADMFVLPTHQENFGFVLVEAMACGSPVITSYGVDIWQEIQQGGAVISKNDPVAVANEIETLLGDKENLKALGSQSREWVFSEFDAAKLAEEYGSMYSDAVG